VDELRFKIDAFRPDTIPMARLAEYMAELATLLGNEKSVHFVRLDPGSVEVVHCVDKEDQPKVDARLDALRRGDGSVDTVKAYRRLDDMLANDNAVGALTAGRDAVIIQFPGKTRPKPVDYGAFVQQGTFDGIPVRVGGLADTVSIHLQETGPTALVHNCVASRSLARAIAPYLFETPVRVHGAGRWRREASGVWTLIKFTISDFEVLDDGPLDIAVARLRDIRGSGWRDVEHPLATLRALRGEEDSVH